ncbi:uncharacterized protein BJ171DRAFT_426795 [Polychytrium aggregatum]|uniref:uncharacterized protein n=1 Tax=Polychytrium aggregatum TaxID=110093 RepID=UPI0022FE942B|nr:uncharacterized protein BJ171DRAFT_426795 [Polychytrium aggregatum]KAI9202214.1 hypothetical protein BJ171DRAFT_426795 [Polychytrium aggregatum]
MNLQAQLARLGGSDLGHTISGHPQSGNGDDGLLDAHAHAHAHEAAEIDALSVSATPAATVRKSVGPASTASVQPTATNTSIQVLEQRQLEYKQHALVAKKGGEMARARELVAVSVNLERVLASLRLGGDLPPNFEMPPHPSTLPKPTVAATSGSSAANSVREAPSPSRSLLPSEPAASVSHETITYEELMESSPVAALSDTANVIEHLETQLAAQIELCTKVSGSYYRTGDKTGALEFHKRKKESVRDLETLRVLKATSSGASIQLPRFVYSTVSYEIRQEFAEIPLDEMEVSIVRAFDLGSKDVASADIDSFVAYDLGWPLDNGGNPTPEAKGETGQPIKKNPSPTYNFVKRIKIDRKNRNFMRFVERKKASFTVFHHKGFTLFSSNKVALGRASVEYKALTGKSEIHEVLQLTDPDNPRKEVGGRLEIRIRLRAPLLKPDILKKTERWVSLDLTPTATTAVPAAVPLAPASVATAAVAVAVAVAIAPPRSVSPIEARPPVPSPTLQTPQVASKPSGQTPAASPRIAAAPLPAEKPSLPTEATGPKPPAEEDIEELEMQFFIAENIESNQVLETEIGKMKEEILKIKSQRKSVPEDLTFRLQSFEMRMDMIVTLVSCGSLTMQGYVDKLKAAIPREKSNALKFKKAQKLDLARVALNRVKLMEGEVSEIEQHLASNPDDE